MHFNNDNGDLTEPTLTYLTLTCPICIFKITKSCGKMKMTVALREWKIGMVS